MTNATILTLDEVAERFTLLGFTKADHTRIYSNLRVSPLSQGVEPIMVVHPDRMFRAVVATNPYLTRAGAEVLSEDPEEQVLQMVVQCVRYTDLAVKVAERYPHLFPVAASNDCFPADQVPLSVAGSVPTRWLKPERAAQLGAAWGADPEVVKGLHFNWTGTMEDLLEAAHLTTR